MQEPVPILLTSKELNRKNATRKSQSWNNFKRPYSEFPKEPPIWKNEKTKLKEKKIKITCN